MKLLLKISILAVIGALLGVGSSMAFPFIEVEGFVNPYEAAIVDNPDNTSTITGLSYTFIVTDDGGTGAEMAFLSLEFENDVFASVSTAYGYDPSDWIAGSISSFGSLYTLSFAGSTIGVGESLSFFVDVDIYDAALTNDVLWQEGQMWGQSWFAIDTMFGGDGGSTAAPVPEPTTMLLLGAGLAGVAVLGNRKNRTHG